MRPVKNVRHLAEGEKQVALPVFNYSIPYEKILISDGLGGGDREFTMPTSVPTSRLFNVSSDDGKYVIHAGDGYFGMTKLREERNTLIHELTHVWQGEHWSSPYWVNSAGMQAAWGLAGGLDKIAGYDSDGKPSGAYSYDRVDLWDWDDYHAEQQAQIVEDWFKNGMKKNPDEDFRFYYVQRHIWGLRSSSGSDWLENYRAKRVPHVEPLPAGSLKEFYIHDMDSYFLPVLQKRFASTDVSGFGARVKELEYMFRRLRSEQACQLLLRLNTNRPGDKIAAAVRGNLSTAARNSLLKVLNNRCRGTDV
jgi:hypothetical protein